MKNYFTLLAAAAASLSFMTTLSQAQDGPTWLLVMTGTEGHVSGNTLTVTEDDGNVFGFTDRPNRNHTFMTSDEFVSLWGPDGDFAASSPNVVLTYVVDGRPVEVELVLHTAEATGSSFTFTFETVVGEMAGEFGAFHIFVDDVNITLCSKHSNCLF